MRVRLDELRLAVALVHSVRDAVLRMSCGGRLVVAARHPAADLDACAMRRAVIASACDSRPNCADWIEWFEIGGSLAPAGGVYRQSGACTANRWLATRLRPETVVEILDRIDAGVGPESLHASLKPDDGLGVTTLAICANDPHAAPMLDEIATAVLAACLVEELIIDARSTRPIAGDG